MMNLDFLIFGAHPDDVEIGMGGTIAKYVSEGFKIGICNITNAELSSNGTVSLRQEEASNAEKVLGIAVREQLDIPDRGIYVQEDNVKEVVAIIRKWKPKVIFFPYYIDRHPDHGNCAALVREAIFSAKIKKFNDKNSLPAHQVERQYSYMINGFHKPDFFVDITNFIHIKQEALSCYRSQFEKEVGGVDTPLTSNYVSAVISREKVFGKEIGVGYAEGFFAESPLVLHYDLVGGARK
ncbi:bacillithiol biosynthesis deacetylase BshB1 [Sutcliffiella cohnii]